MSGEREIPQRCPAIRADGEPCIARPGFSGFCIGHSPGALEARRKGGAASSKVARAKKLLPARLRPVADTIERAIEEVHQGSLDPRCAQAIASLAGALVKVIAAGEIEDRLRKLESDAK